MAPLTRPRAKKALLVGIRYSTLPKKHVLESTYCDVDRLKKFLTDNVGFRSDNIIELKDNIDPEHDQYPTRKNLVKALEELVSEAQAGDHLVFHSIWPADVVFAGKDEEINVILDDDIKRILVDKVPDGAHLVIILDCCHSGTGADLRYSYTDHLEEKDCTQASNTSPASQVAEPKRKLTLPGLTGDKPSKDALSPTISSPLVTSPGGGPVVISWAACPDPKTTLGFLNSSSSSNSDNSSNSDDSSGSGGSFIKACFSRCFPKPGEKKDATHEELLHRIKVKMIASAEDHFTQHRHLFSEQQWRDLQKWWKEDGCQPMLGVLHDYHGVLRTPVAETFGVDASS
ncbi:uncharacterized protein PHACADRAFT_206967 [Phanerochaete carnosa HHB-10118-sp]|uniref:Peptidase C14 caspase domain-containing protein n=1 Tax=Phanerochaete carnosa (strain HHB-10118-sp) TaxID=650164 RepID=K5WFP4_PHACS|nr:uncharacterized protein PHACADRAFT_206967 [Phanerochaete carnosa HHB-10118-sp]EKM58130.1 hypothetical protein PHACADRAFT_206967 [Phanerochaete carnosa HHB-10118-sp]